MLQNLKNNWGDYARDIKLNLDSVLSVDGAPGLSEEQILGTALSCVYATKNQELIRAFVSEVTLDEARKKSAKVAATIMAMNNVYYRFIHLSESSEFGSLPARLRMNGLANPGIDKAEFELYCLAVSAMAGCGLCIKSHVHEVKKAGYTNEAVQSAVRIAAVINATTQVLAIEETKESL